MSKDINLDDLSAIYYYVEPKECGNLKRAIMVHYEFYFDSNIAEWTFNEKQMDFSEDQWNVNNTLWEASIIGSEYRLEILELNTDDKKSDITYIIKMMIRNTNLCIIRKLQI